MEFRWIQISLFLTALLHFTAGFQSPHRIVRVGEDVTLFCENVIRNQPECSYTDWLFNDPTNSGVKLVELGQIGKKSGAKSDRLRVTANCSLIIKKVKWFDVGRYVCQQHPTTGEQVPDSVVDLSLLTMEEIKSDDDDKVTSRCTVRTYEQNTCRVKWVYEGKDVDEQLQTVGTQHLLCYTDVTFETNHFIYTSGHNSLQCEVSTANNKQLFPFRPQPSGRKPVEYNHDRESRTTAETPEQPTSAPRPTGNRETPETTPTPETKEASDDCRCCSGLDFFMLALRVSELVLVSLLTVLLFRAGGNQRPPDENKVRYNRHEDSVQYENVEESSASSRRH